MELRPIKSSNIKAAGYADGTLRIEFTNGRQYDYKAVPEAEARALFDSESAGSYFARSIRPVYVGEPVGVTSTEATAATTVRIV